MADEGPRAVTKWKSLFLYPTRNAGNDDANAKREQNGEEKNRRGKR